MLPLPMHTAPYALVNPPPKRTWPIPRSPILHTYALHPRAQVHSVWYPRTGLIPRTCTVHANAQDYLSTRKPCLACMEIGSSADAHLTAREPLSMHEPTHTSPCTHIHRTQCSHLLSIACTHAVHVPSTASHVNVHLPTRPRMS